MEDYIDHKFPFLEQRQYLHGTTLFTALSTYLKDAQNIVYKIPHMLSTNHVRLHLNNTVVENPNSTVSWSEGSVKKFINITCLEEARPHERITYAENLVSNAVNWSEKRVSYSGPPLISFAGTLIPLNKTLLAKFVPPQPNGQWLFTRLELNACVDRFETIGLEVSNILMGGQLVKSSIFINDTHVGSCYFSWLQSE